MTLKALVAATAAVCVRTFGLKQTLCQLSHQGKVFVGSGRISTLLRLGFGYKYTAQHQWRMLQVVLRSESVLDVALGAG